MSKCKSRGHSLRSPLDHDGGAWLDVREGHGAAWGEIGQTLGKSRSAGSWHLSRSAEREPRSRNYVKWQATKQRIVERKGHPVIRSAFSMSMVRGSCIEMKSEHLASERLIAGKLKAFPRKTPVSIFYLLLTPSNSGPARPTSSRRYPWNSPRCLPRGSSSAMVARTDRSRDLARVRRALVPEHKA